MQQAKASRAHCVVTDPKAVRWLTDIERARFLKPFFRCAVTVGEAAAELCADPNWTYKQVKCLEKLGLLELSRTEAKRGRPLRYYRTAADEFFVPREAVSFEDFLYQLGYQLEQTLAHNLSETFKNAQGELPGLRVFCGEGSVAVLGAAAPGRSWEPSEGSSPAHSMWKRVTLDYEDALNLRNELDALLGKYSVKEGQQAYILRLALAPGTF